MNRRIVLAQTNKMILETRPMEPTTTVAVAAAAEAVPQAPIRTRTAPLATPATDAVPRSRRRRPNRRWRWPQVFHQRLLLPRRTARQMDSQMTRRTTAPVPGPVAATPIRMPMAKPIPGIKGATTTATRQTRAPAAAVCQSRIGTTRMRTMRLRLVISSQPARPLPTVLPVIVLPMSLQHPPAAAA